MQTHPGFVFIEILITLFLISFVFIFMEKMLISALHMNQQAWFQTIANTQLDNLTSVMRMSPQHWRNFYPVWLEKNQRLLPRASASVEHIGRFDRISVLWRANLPYLWHCDGSRIPKRACLEMRL